MADEKKNPLIGAFRTPEPPKAPPDPAPVPPKAPAIDTAAPGKPSEEKKPAEPPKAPIGAKAPATGPAAPGKPGDEKKPAEPPKAPTDAKPPATDPAAPGKPSDAKKPAEPPKASADSKPPAEPAVIQDEIPKNFKLEIVPENDLGKVVLLPIDLIDDFEGHPFPVTDDKEMWDLVESVKQFGILENATVIPSEKNPGRYEMVAGHRRKRASQLSGRTHIPAIVRSMDHDTAVIYMVDSVRP